VTTTQVAPPSALPKHPANFVTIRTISWTQPAGALDEITGYASVAWPGGCTYDLNSGIELKIIRNVDNFVISAESPTAARNGNAVEDAAAGVVMLAPNFTSGAARTDIINLPLEVYQFAPSPAATSRRVTIKARYRECAGTGGSIPAGVPSISNVQVFVKRFSPG
jgi:hypothetical protein